MFVSFYTILKQMLKIFWSSTPTTSRHCHSFFKIRHNGPYGSPVYCTPLGTTSSTEDPAKYSRMLYAGHQYTLRRKFPAAMNPFGPWNLRLDTSDELN
jgi:hypothetical protein